METLRRDGPRRLRIESPGVVAGGDQQGGSSIDADAVDSEQLRCVGFEERGDPDVEFSHLALELADPVGQRGQCRLGGCRHGSAARVGRKPLAAATSWVMGRPLILACSWSGAVNVSWRIWVSALTRACRADRLATTRTRMASTDPSLHLAFPCALPDSDGPGRLDGVERIGLAAVSSGLAVLTVHFDDLDPCPSEVTGDSGAVGPRALDADLGDHVRITQPGQQCRIAVGLGTKDRVPSSTPTSSTRPPRGLLRGCRCRR